MGVWCELAGCGVGDLASAEQLELHAAYKHVAFEELVFVCVLCDHRPHFASPTQLLKHKAHMHQGAHVPLEPPAGVLGVNTCDNIPAVQGGLTDAASCNTRTGLRLPPGLHVPQVPNTAQQIVQDANANTKKRKIDDGSGGMDFAESSQNADEKLANGGIDDLMQHIDELGNEYEGEHDDNEDVDYNYDYDDPFIDTALLSEIGRHSKKPAVKADDKAHDLKVVRGYAGSLRLIDDPKEDPQATLYRCEQCYYTSTNRSNLRKHKYYRHGKWREARKNAQNQAVGGDGDASLPGPSSVDATNPDRRSVRSHFAYRFGVLRTGPGNAPGKKNYYFQCQACVQEMSAAQPELGLDEVKQLVPWMHRKTNTLDMHFYSRHKKLCEQYADEKTLQAMKKFEDRGKLGRGNGR